MTDATLIFLLSTLFILGFIAGVIVCKAWEK